MTGHPIWIFSEKFEFVLFSFFTLKDLSKMISYLYFGYLHQKLYLKNKIMSHFWNQACFFQKSVFWLKKKLGEMSSFMVLQVQNPIYIFLSKIWRPNFENLRDCIFLILGRNHVDQFFTSNRTHINLWNYQVW
jgi:hypothetical protein